jgi:hypothetical protein
MTKSGFEHSIIFRLIRHSNFVIRHFPTWAGSGATRRLGDVWLDGQITTSAHLAEDGRDVAPKPGRSNDE